MQWTRAVILPCHNRVVLGRTRLHAYYGVLNKMTWSTVSKVIDSRNESLGDLDEREPWIRPALVLIIWHQYIVAKSTKHK